MLNDQENTVAFIPAAGLGTRLMPLTRSKPKALVSFMGKPMLQSVIERIGEQGIKRFIINIHHFPDQMRSFIEKMQKNYDITISDESNNLLDTGGGLAKAASLLKPGEHKILVHNVDIFTEISLTKMLLAHQENKADVTLAVSDRRSSRRLIFAGNQLQGWKNIKTGEVLGSNNLEKPKLLSFSGIHVINASTLQNTSTDEPFPLIPWYVEKSNSLKIQPWQHISGNWFDLGTIKQIEQAEQYVYQRQ